ncbi:hypothetical protein WJT74_07870 [Sphingomicrobium sp. XHP0239]|uniref:hypothetical protein n=1 Tax=Sphingomicrobium maritimum TaxID=3133972 RepID=UPI0031CC7837
MTNESNELNPVADVLKRLGESQRLMEGDIEIVREGISELRRLSQAASHRRGGAGSRDAKKYELGSVLWLHGLGDLDAQTLTGLLAHPALLLRWLGQELIRDESAPVVVLVARLLSQPGRAAFLKQWGRILEWRYRKPLYDATVSSFLESGRTGPDEAWRSRDIKIEQQALMDTLADLLEIDDPQLKTRGEAFDWIYKYGGNPTYWREPPIPDVGGGEQ